MLLKGTIANQIFTFANVYAPNVNQIPWLVETLALLDSYKKGVVVLGGDLNIAVNPSLDSSSKKSALSARALRRLKNKLQQGAIYDVWRLRNPSRQDYTFFSHPHSSYQRLDYLFMSKEHLHLCTSAYIGNMLLSAHAPVFITILAPSLEPKAFRWRLNEQLISTEENLKNTQKLLEEFFSFNSLPETSPQILWDTHKAYMRGQFISMGSRIKKERKKRVDDLLAQIH